MSHSNWRSNIAIAGGVVAGVFLALWFSTVVALGPASGNTKARIESQSASQEKSDGPSDRNPSAAKENQKAPTKEAECSNENQNYYDCLIQLRAARAAERQAYVAVASAWVSGFTLFFT